MLCVFDVLVKPLSGLDSKAAFVCEPEMVE